MAAWEPLDQVSSKLIKAFGTFSRKASVVVVLIGCVVILGWIFDIALFKSVLPGSVAMKANTAIALILGGVSVILWHWQPTTLITRRAGQVCAVGVLLIGLLTLIEYIFNLNLGIDQLLFKTLLDPLGDAAPGRMAVHTAFNFFLLGFTLLLLSRRHRHYLPTQFFASVVFLIALLGLLGYLFGNAVFYRIGSPTSMAVHTSVAFLLLSLAILLARPNTGAIAIFTRNDAGGIMARRLVPAAIAIPPLVCWLVLLSYRGQIYTSEMGMCLLSILNVIVFAVMIGGNASSLSAIDRQRRRAELALQQANEVLEQRVLERTKQLQIEIADRTQVEAQIQQLNETLERRVSDRTTQLAEANAELEAFCYSVSHDLRAPLRTMQGFTQALLEDYGEQLDQTGHDYASYIVEAAVQMDTLIGDLLAYSRLGRSEIQLQPTDLNFVVQEALKQLAAQLQERQAEVTVDYPLPQVLAHRPILVQIVTNLISNAVKFVEPGTQPKVRVSSEISPSWIRLWVVDNGIGIAPEYQERIFRVFERLHGVEIYPGTGIGLAIVRKGIERMGGQVGVQSQPGKGSQFWIDLPVPTEKQS